MPQVTYFAPGIQIDVQRRAAASESEGNFLPLRVVRIDEMTKRQVSKGIAIVNQYRFVAIKEIFDVLYAPRCIQKHRFIPEDYGSPPPLPIRECLMVCLCKVMGIDDKAFYTGRYKMIHCIGNQRASAGWQERFWTVIGQRAQARSQPGAENERGSDR